MKFIKTTTSVIPTFNVDVQSSKYYGLIVNDKMCFISTDVDGFYLLVDATSLKANTPTEYQTLESYLVWLITKLELKVFQFHDKKQLFAWIALAGDSVKEPKQALKVEVVISSQHSLEEPCDEKKYYGVKAGVWKGVITREHFDKGLFIVKGITYITMGSEILDVNGNYLTGKTLEDTILAAASSKNTSVYEFDNLKDFTKWLGE